MKYFVLTPLAAFLLLLLLLLMVHLADLNSTMSHKPIRLSDAPFELKNISFEKQSPEPQLEPARLSPPELSTAAMEEPSLEALLDTLLESAEIPEPQSLELLLDEPQVDLSADLRLDVELLDNVLDSVAVSPSKPAIKKTVKPKKRTKKKIPKVVVKQGSTKPLKRTSRQAKTAAAKAKSQPTSISSSQNIAPAALKKVKPKYPSRARRRGIEGEVVVAFQVSPSGAVLRNSIRVVSAKPAKIFNKTVVAAISRWRFAKSNASYKTTQKLVFSLTK
jgi:protein TonB